MPFEKFESSIEKRLERTQEEEKAREKLIDFTKGIVESLKKEGVPVTEDCRIEIDAFKNVYPENIINKDKEEVKKLEREWWRKQYGKEITEEKIKEKRQKTDGEKLEMLKTVIFAKNLSEDFIVARTSFYDDIKNKIDNVILEKETGNIVCALDEVGESMSVEYQEKVEKIMARNKKEDGGKLKYGLKIEKDKESKSKLVLGEVKNIPLFYLVLPKRHIEEGIKQFNPSFEQKSDYEEKLFTYFLGTFFTQINYLKLERKLNPELKTRLERFEKILQKFKK